MQTHGTVAGFSAMIRYRTQHSDSHTRLGTGKVLGMIVREAHGVNGCN